jgi:PQQ-like domain
MHWMRRFALAATAATAVATVFGIAAPANANFTHDPVSLPWNPDGGVHASTTGNGVVYLGGKLDGTGGIAAVDASTGSLLWRIPANNDVRALALSTDGTTLYAGGNFSTVNGITHRHLVAINVADHSLITGFKGTAAGMVRDLMPFGNDLYVAGKVTKVGGVLHRGIGALNATTGAPDASFTFQADNDVLGLAMTGTRLILSGSFTQISGSPRVNLAMIDLATNTLTSWAPDKLCSGCNQEFDVATDGINAYVAGSGNAAGAYSLATGKLAWPIIRGTGDFQAIALPGDGEVYFGGHFGLGVWSGAKPQNQVPARGLVSVFTATGQIDPSWTPMLFTAYPGVWAMTPAAGKLWVGGDFTGEQVNGNNNKKPYLAAYPGI